MGHLAPDWRTGIVCTPSDTNKIQGGPRSICLVGWKFLHLFHLFESRNPISSDGLIFPIPRGWVRGKDQIKWMILEFTLFGRSGEKRQASLTSGAQHEVTETEDAGLSFGVQGSVSCVTTEEHMGEGRRHANKPLLRKPSGADCHPQLFMQPYLKAVGMACVGLEYGEMLHLLTGRRNHSLRETQKHGI